MLGVVKRKFKKKRCCFIEANGVRYFVFDPLKRWKDGDVVQFIPGIDEKGPVAQFVEGVGNVAGNKIT